MRSAHVLMMVENEAVPFDRRVWLEAKAIRQAGHAVTVVSPRSPRATRFAEHRDGIRILRYPRLLEARRPWEYGLEYLNAYLWQSVVALSLALTWRVDVVHLANPPDGAFLIGALLRPFGSRVVFDQHDLSPEIYEEKFHRRGWLWRALLFCERVSYRAADVVITSNESMRRNAIVRGGKPPDRVRVVRNGPVAGSSPVEPDLRLKRGRPHAVGYMGVISSQDGLDGLVRVMAEIVRHRQRDDIQFVVIGDGTALAGVRSDVAAHRLEDHVTFTGYLTGDAFSAALEAIDVCVSPEPGTILNHRSTLVKLMDYMAHSKPIVATDLSEARITGGDTVAWVAPDDESEMADRILSLVDDSTARKDLGSRAGQRAETVLAWRQQVPALLSAYRSVLGGGDA